MDSMDDILGDELSALKEKLAQLESENSKLIKIIKDNDLEDELDDMEVASVEEMVCLNGIKHIAERVKFDDFDDKDIKSFDTLLKALRMIRGQSVPKESKKKFNIQDALKIVEGI